MDINFLTIIITFFVVSVTFLIWKSRNIFQTTIKDPVLKLCNNFKGHRSTVYDLCHTLSGQIVSASWDSSVKLWEINSEASPTIEKCLETFGDISNNGDPSTQVWSLAVLPNGLILSGSRDGMIRIWDPTTAECILDLHEHKGPVSTLSVITGGTIVSGGADSTIKIWKLIKIMENGGSTESSEDLNGEELVSTLSGHSEIISCILVRNLKNQIISGSYDKTIRIWSLDNMTCLRVLEGHSKSICCLAQDPISNLVLSGSMDKSLRVWDISSIDEKTKSDNLDNNDLLIQIVEDVHKNTISSIGFVPNSYVQSANTNNKFSYIITTSWDSTIKVWVPSHVSSAFELKNLQSLPKETSQTKKNKIGIYGIGRCVFATEPSTNALCENITSHVGPIRCLDVLSDGTIVTGGSDNLVLSWKLVI